MSTATIADGPSTTRRTLSAIRADMADAIADKQGAKEQAWEFIAWVPRKVWGLLRKVASTLRLDVAAQWAMSHGRTVVDVVGTKTSATMLLTSKSGQRFIGWSLGTAFNLLGWTLKTAYAVVTWPLRQVPPVRRLVDAGEAAVTRIVNSGPITTARIGGKVAGGYIGEFLSAERWWISAVNVVAMAIALLRITRRWAPSGLWRFAAYVVEAPFVATRITPLMQRFGWTRSVWSRVVDVEATDASERVVQEATHAARVAAEETADQAEADHLALEREITKLQGEGKTVPAEMLNAAEAASDKAIRLREQAEALGMAEDAGTAEPVIPVEVITPPSGQHPQANGGKAQGGGQRPRNRDKGGQGSRR